MDTPQTPAQTGNEPSISILAFAAERMAEPWPAEYTTLGWREVGVGIDARALHNAYVAWCQANGIKPVGITAYGLWDVPGVERVKDQTSGRMVYNGITVETRAERAYQPVHDELHGAELTRRAASEPWVGLYRAHRRKHVDRYRSTGEDADMTCSHELPAEVVAGLADVESTIAPAVVAEVETRYGAWLRFNPDGPNPELVAQLERLRAAGIKDYRTKALYRALLGSGEVVQSEDQRRRAADWAVRMAELRGTPEDSEGDPFATY